VISPKPLVSLLTITASLFLAANGHAQHRSDSAPPPPPPPIVSTPQPDLFDIEVGFDYLRLPDDVVKNMYGFDISVFANITSWLGLGGEFIADFGSTTVNVGFFRNNLDVSEDRLIYVFGPRLTIWRDSQFQVFADLLAGGANADIKVSTPFSRVSASESVNGFAANLGAGAEWRFAPHWWWRVVQVDYVPIHAQGEWESDWRFSTAISYGFGLGR
jgi:hypothetical protein